MKVKRGFGFNASIAVLFFIFLFLFSSFISADCSLGATPLTMEAKVQPGQTVEATFNLYNLYGDRATHIIINKTSGPNWEISYDPALHVQAYDISGVIVNKTENFAVENMTTVLTIPTNSSDGISYVKYPLNDSYIPAKTIKIYIKVPDNAKLGQNYVFEFQAKGDCFSDPTTVVPGVAIPLSVNITAANNVAFSEKPVSTTATGSTIFGNLGTTTTILLIVAVVFVIGFFVLLIRGMRKSAKEKKAKMSNAGSGVQGNSSTPPKDKPKPTGLSYSESH